MTRSILDLDALAETPIAEGRYRWGYVAKALRPEGARALRDTFPGTGFWRLRRGDAEKNMDFRIRCLVPLGRAGPLDAASLDPVWRAFVDELLSDAYRESRAAALGIDLTDKPLELSAWRWGPGAEIGPHPDIPRKVASEIFYFNEDWDPRWGGCLRILRSSHPDDAVCDLPPTLGSASLIVRSESSWHLVAPVSREAREERLSVVATWQHPGSGSPFWTVGPDGSARCHARGSVRSSDPRGIFAPRSSAA